jgi:hypothetical protein
VGVKASHTACLPVCPSVYLRACLPMAQSFLDTRHDDEQYKNVAAVIVDPSCSGSGMVSRLDHVAVRAMLVLTSCRTCACVPMSPRPHAAGHDGWG